MGTPQSEALHLVERYRLIDVATAKEYDLHGAGRPWPWCSGNRALRSQRPGAATQHIPSRPEHLTTPWSAQIPIAHDGPWSEQVCAENIVEYLAGMNIGVPKADKPISDDQSDFQQPDRQGQTHCRVDLSGRMIPVLRSTRCQNQLRSIILRSVSKDTLSPKYPSPRNEQQSLFSTTTSHRVIIPCNS